MLGTGEPGPLLPLREPQLRPARPQLPLPAGASDGREGRPHGPVAAGRWHQPPGDCVWCWTAAAVAACAVTATGVEREAFSAHHLGTRWRQGCPSLSKATPKGHCLPAWRRLAVGLEGRRRRAKARPNVAGRQLAGKRGHQQAAG